MPQFQQPALLGRFRPPEDIQFLHPGYRNGPRTLLTLPRVDGTAEGGYGVLHGIAHSACAIIAANAFDGYLTLDEAGTQRVQLPMDELLTAESYFFFVGETATRYPVTPSFDDWEFPHGRIPELWRIAYQYLQVLGTTAQGPGIGPCAFSGFNMPVEEAYLVPKKEEAWFVANNMGYYLENAAGDIGDADNTIALRRDVHFIFDQGHFAIVPKKPTPDSTTRFVGHMLGAATFQYHDMIQNTMPNGLHHRSLPFLFARFGWAILLRVKRFVTSFVDREVRVRALDKDGARTYIVTKVCGEDLRKNYGGGGTQSATPIGTPKRNSGGTIGGDGQGSEEDSDSSSSDDDAFFWDIPGGKQNRRLQQSSDGTVPADNKPTL